MSYEMEVLTILGLLITTTAGVRFNVQSDLPDSEEGIMQPVFRNKFDVASIYPHLVYVAPGSGIVVSRVNNEEITNYGRKVYQEQIPKSPLPSVNSLPRRGVTQRQISNEQFLKEVTPTTHTLLEKQDDKATAPFTPTVTSPEIENKKRNRYELHAQVEESDNSEEDLHPQYNAPNSDFRVLYVQGNQEDNNRIVFVNLKPKATLSANQLTKQVPLRKRVFAHPQETRYGYEDINEENPPRSITNKNFAQFSLAHNANERMELDHNKQLLSTGLGHLHTNQRILHQKHDLEEDLPEQEQFSFYIKQLQAQKSNKQQKYGDLGGSNSNVPDSRSNKHKKLPVILRTRHGDQYQVNRRNPAISPDFQYEDSPYMQYAAKERAVRIIQDEEE